MRLQIKEQGLKPVARQINRKWEVTERMLADSVNKQNSRLWW
jgi:hypothetical protein